MYNVHYPYLGLPPAERGVVGRILQHLKDGQLLQLLLVPPLLVQVLVPVRLAGYWTCRVSLPPPPAPGSGSTLDKSKTEEILNDILFARSNTD